MADQQSQHSGIIPTVQNVVSTVNLHCPLDVKDLKYITMKAWNTEYDPSRFAGVVMRIRNPYTTARIFASGKVLCTGAKSEELSRLAARKYARIIQKLGFPVKFKGFKIHNLVASCDVNFPIRLQGIAAARGAFSRYNPERFPGLTYRMEQSKVVLTVFASGKFNLTGAKAMHEIYTALEFIYPVLSQFRRVQK